MKPKKCHETTLHNMARPLSGVRSEAYELLEVFKIIESLGSTQQQQNLPEILKPGLTWGSFPKGALAFFWGSGFSKPG